MQWSTPFWVHENKGLQCIHKNCWKEHGDSRILQDDGQFRSQQKGKLEGGKRRPHSSKVLGKVSGGDLVTDCGHWDNQNHVGQWNSCCERVQFPEDLVVRHQAMCHEAEKENDRWHRNDIQKVSEDLQGPLQFSSFCIVGCKIVVTFKREGRKTESI